MGNPAGSAFPIRAVFHERQPGMIVDGHMDVVETSFVITGVVHGCTIEDDCLVGMGATILDGAVVGSKSLVTVGAVVLEGTVIPSRSLVTGSSRQGAAATGR